MAPDFERLARMPWPIASFASSGIKDFSSALDRVPNLSRVALLTDPKTDPGRERTIKANQAAAKALGIELWSVDIAGPGEVEPAFSKIAEDHADGVVGSSRDEPTRPLRR